MKRKKYIGGLIAVLGIILILLAGCGSLDDILPTIDQPTEEVDRDMPGEPFYSQFVLDCRTRTPDSPEKLIQPVLGCDDWEGNRFERPFNSIYQDEYYPDLDILNADFGLAGGWFYLRVALYDPRPETGRLEGSYGIEIDLDEDGRGDVLVIAQRPGQDGEGEWSDKGVQVWEDSNNDVGNQKPEQPDGPGGNGYDQMVFDQGEGDDPDAAWARAFFAGSAYVEIAFKEELLGGAGVFQWWVWSDEGVVNYEGFDYHDTYSHEDAGCANEGKDYFPVNKVFALDNTCTVRFGAPPSSDPDLCSNDPNKGDFEPPGRVPPCDPICGDGVCDCGEDNASCPGECPPPCVQVCGDGVCDCGEDDISCPGDCPDPCIPTCGDGLCNCGEDHIWCPPDCANPCVSTCGDGICECIETVTCPGDCPPCVVMGTCGDGVCECDEPFTCPGDCPPCDSVCGDDICECDEAFTCPEDCPCESECGDDICECDEAFTCAEDCPCESECGDGVCSCAETNTSCPGDCPPCVATCGDGVCECGETDTSCPGDCGPCERECGDGVCNCGEDNDTCPDDCPPPTCNNNCLCDVDAGEDPNSCPNDCPQPYCGDGVCSCGDTPNNCPTDCPPSCNNNCKCNPGAGENQNNCPNDCPTPYCGDGNCSCGEDERNCKQDCAAGGPAPGGP